MGLDITAYSRLKHIGLHYEGSWCEEQYDEDTFDRVHVPAFAYDSFPQSFRGIPNLGTKRGVSGDSVFIEGGCYAITPETQVFGFGAGSYLGYNAWREDLARQFNPVTITRDTIVPGMTEPDPEKPFYELIWFADNEGTIGPEAAADLLDDFREWRVSYNPQADSYRGEFYMRAYANWTRAFELAADGGLVEFH